MNRVDLTIYDTFFAQRPLGMELSQSQSQTQLS
jgi:hypothetical protein